MVTKPKRPTAAQSLELFRVQLDGRPLPEYIALPEDTGREFSLAVRLISAHFAGFGMNIRYIKSVERLTFDCRVLTPAGRAALENGEK